MDSVAEPAALAGNGAPRRIQPMPVRRQVEDALRDAIVTGHYPPGTHLSDRALMETFGTSRQIIREAIRLLEAEGLIEHRPHRGPIVATLMADEAEEIYAGRAQLEGLVAHEFARKASESDRAALRAAFERLSRSGAADGKETILAIKQQIYDILLAGCGNSYASRMLMTILHRNRQLRAYSLSAPGRLKHTIEEVRAIVDAIDRRDAEGAAAACRLHVQKAAEVALPILRAHEAKQASQLGNEEGEPASLSSSPQSLIDESML